MVIVQPYRELCQAEGTRKVAICRLHLIEKRLNLRNILMRKLSYVPNELKTD